MTSLDAGRTVTVITAEALTAGTHVLGRRSQVDVAPIDRREDAKG